jgi:hypothetical protein
MFYLNVTKVESIPNFFSPDEIRITLKNGAKLASYKNFRFTNELKSATGSMIMRKSFIIYQLIEPGETISFKIKKEQWSDDIRMNFITLISASPANVAEVKYWNKKKGEN